MKKLITAVLIFTTLATCILLMMGGFSVYAEETETSGSCGIEGAALNWSFDKATGELIIRGNGKIKDYSKLAMSGKTAAPWRAFADTVKTVRLEKINETDNPTLGAYSFAHLKNLTSVSLPSSVLTIPTGAFYGCSSLETLNIPTSVTEIGENAFYCCSAMKSISLPSSVSKIYIDSFYGCGGLTDITVDSANTVYRSEAECIIETATDTVIRGSADGIIPASAKATGEYSFSGCTSLTEVTVPETIEIIGYGTFAGCTELTSVTLPFIGNKRVTADSAGNESFELNQGCLWYIFGDNGVPKSLREVIITDAETIEAEAFAGCSSLTSIILPHNLKLIKDGAFFLCTGIDEILLTNELTEIGMACFSGCSGLKTIALPDSLLKIGTSAFYGCTELMSFTVGAGVEILGEGLLAGCSKLERLSVIEGNPKYYSSNNCIIETATETLIAGCKNSIIPQEIKRIGDGAFRNCVGLTTLELPSGLIGIGNYAFDSCVGLTALNIPENVVEVGDYAFNNCRGLTTIKASENIKYGESVFKNCISLQSEGMKVSELKIPSSSGGCKGCGSVAMNIVALVALLGTGITVIIVGKHK